MIIYIDDSYEALGLDINDNNAVYIHETSCYLTDESIPSRDLNQWRGALTEHEQLLKRWEKAWVCLMS